MRTREISVALVVVELLWLVGLVSRRGSVRRNEETRGTLSLPPTPRG